MICCNLKPCSSTGNKINDLKPVRLYPSNYEMGGKHNSWEAFSLFCLIFLKTLKTEAE